jgi:hypothetical protein
LHHFSESFAGWNQLDHKKGEKSWSIFYHISEKMSNPANPTSQGNVTGNGPGIGFENRKIHYILAWYSGQVRENAEPRVSRRLDFSGSGGWAGPGFSQLELDLDNPVTLWYDVHRVLC